MLTVTGHIHTLKHTLDTVTGHIHTLKHTLDTVTGHAHTYTHLEHTHIQTQTCVYVCVCVCVHQRQEPPRYPPPRGLSVRPGVNPHLGLFREENTLISIKCVTNHTAKFKCFKDTRRIKRQIILK